MGSFFSSPSPPPVTTFVASQVVDTSEKTASEDAKKINTTQVNRKGLAQNVNTSWRGVLNETAFNPVRKSLLGE